MVKDVVAETQHPILLWGLAVLFVAGGSYLTHINFLGLEWVTRAGCIIVALGIWSGLGGIVQERIIHGRLEFKHRLEVARLKKRLRQVNAPTEDVEAQLQALQTAFDKESDAYLSSIRLHLGLLEVSLLMVGTLIWGFGDLVLFI